MRLFLTAELKYVSSVKHVFVHQLLNYMYSINTQLAYFKYGSDPKRMLANITWFKYAVISDLKIQGVPLKDFEIEEFKRYMDRNKSNFPGQYFLEQAPQSDQNILILNSLSTSLFPSFLILSNNALQTGSGSIYKVMPATLTDESYLSQKDYDLSFDLLGKIQVYKIN